MPRTDTLEPLLDLEGVVGRLRPGERLSHVSAARWCDIPLPRDADLHIHVTGEQGAAQVRRPGWIGHRSDPEPAWEVRGVRVSAPERLYLELAGMLDTAALVAVGDHLVLAPRIATPGRPFTSLEALRAASAPDRRTRHGRRARAALDLVRLGVESPMETALRLLLRDAGLPEPVCGYELPGIGWFDLAWPEYRVLGEYDGDQHRTSPQQYEKDIRRFDLAADDRWRPIRVRAWGMTTAAGRLDTVARFSRALGV